MFANGFINGDVNGNFKVRHTLTMRNVNPNIKNITYEAQGRMNKRIVELEKELREGVKKPFSELIKANIGDCQAMGQTPITYIREVMALITCPSLMAEKGGRFKSDVRRRATSILSCCEGSSVGAYTNWHGIECVRKHVGEFIQRRDGGIPPDFKNITLTSGTADAIKSVLTLLLSEVDGKKPGVMVPIPVYPLYSSALGEFGMQQIDYYLDEDNAWALNINDLRRSIDDARKHCNPTAIVVINPGNPTGQVLTESNIQEIIRFAYDECLIILADEVYQHNVYAPGSQFHSFKKVMSQMEAPYNKTEIASFMSCSKGYTMECGFRGGYVEFANFLPEILALYAKLRLAMSCPTTLGQAMLDCVVNPPQPGEPSFERFHAEKTRTLTTLADSAKMMTDAYNSMEGVSCNEVQGALYAFPRIMLPANVIAKAKKAGESPDAFYALALLEKTGICIVPGSGFGQKPGTYHFRTTILPQTEKLKIMLDRFRTFHDEFLRDYIK